MASGARRPWTGCLRRSAARCGVHRGAPFVRRGVRPEQAGDGHGRGDSGGLVQPHAHVFVDVKDESGKIVNWDFELAGPNGLMQGLASRFAQAGRDGDRVRIHGQERPARRQCVGYHHERRPQDVRGIIHRQLTASTVTPRAVIEKSIPSLIDLATPPGLSVSNNSRIDFAIRSEVHSQQIARLRAVITLRGCYHAPGQGLPTRNSGFAPLRGVFLDSTGPHFSGVEIALFVGREPVDAPLTALARTERSP